MHHTGIEKVIYGVEDLEVAKKFWRDFGLESIVEDLTHAVFAAQNNATIEVYPTDDPALPPPVATNTKSTVREVTFGVHSVDDLTALKRRLSATGNVTEDDDGAIHAADHWALALRFGLRNASRLRRRRSRLMCPAISNVLISVVRNSIRPRH